MQISKGRPSKILVCGGLNTDRLKKVVTPGKTGVQGFSNLLRLLDSDFRWNDRDSLLATFFKFVGNTFKN